MVAPQFARYALGFAALISLFLITLSCADSFVHSRVFDFNVFWDAARRAWTGRPGAAWIEGIFFHPPPFLLAVQLFALLPLAAGLTAWVVVTLLSLIGASRGHVGLSATAILAFPPSVVNGIIGQTGFLIGALYLAAARLFTSRPLLSGAMLGAMVIKPQMGLLVPFALIAGREWRAFTGACGGLILMCGLAALAYGAESFPIWLASLDGPQSVLMEGGSGWQKMASVFATIRTLGGTQNFAMATHVAVALLALMAVIRTWAFNRDSSARFAVLACATSLASPYFYVYDLVFLILPVAWCYHNSGKGWLVVVATTALVPASLLNWFPTSYPNPTPLVTLLLLAISWMTSEAMMRAKIGDQAPKSKLTLKADCPLKPPLVQPDARPHPHDLRIAQSYR
jgi:Glycosyltransferase family 87